MKHLKEISSRVRELPTRRKVDMAAWALIGTGVAKMAYAVNAGASTNIFLGGLAKTAISGLGYDYILNRRIAEDQASEAQRDYEE
jgi:hypothetical protein